MTGAGLTTPNLTILEGLYAVHRLAPDAEVPASVSGCPFFSITRTAEELSIVAPQAIAVEGARTEPDWACLKVDGPLDFGLTGILAGIAGVLANAGISLFAVSTFDTDYIFVKAGNLPAAITALTANGYSVK